MKKDFFLHCCRIDKIIRMIDVQVSVELNENYWHDHRPKAKQKLKDIETEIYNVLQKYFDESSIIVDYE